MDGSSSYERMYNFAEDVFECPPTSQYYLVANQLFDKEYGFHNIDMSAFRKKDVKSKHRNVIINLHRICTKANAAC